MRGRKLIGITVVVVLAAIAVLAVMYYIPKKVSLTLDGLKYQLGADHANYSQPVSVRVDGKLKKNLIGTKTFVGTIEIEGEEIPVPENQRKLVIKFQENGAGHIVYFTNGEYGRFYSYGSLYMNTDINKVTFALLTKDEEDPAGGGGSWTATEGFMISAPAVDRVEALEISNELMKDYLGSYTLQ